MVCLAPIPGLNNLLIEIAYIILPCTTIFSFLFFILQIQLSTAIIILILISCPFPSGPSLVTLCCPTFCCTSGARARNPPSFQTFLFNVVLHTAEISHFAPIQLDLKPDPPENLVLLVSLPHPFDDRAPMHPKLGH